MLKPFATFFWVNNWQKQIYTLAATRQVDPPDSPLRTVKSFWGPTPLTQLPPFFDPLKIIQAKLHHNLPSSPLSNSQKRHSTCGFFPFLWNGQWLSRGAAPKPSWVTPSPPLRRQTHRLPRQQPLGRRKRQGWLAWRIYPNPGCQSQMSRFQLFSLGFLGLRNVILLAWGVDPIPKNDIFLKFWLIHGRILSWLMTCERIPM